MGTSKTQYNELFRKQLQEQITSGGTVRFLNNEDFTLDRLNKGSYRMTLIDDRCYLMIRAKRCFPFSFPDKYISLCDGDDEEIGVIKDIGVLSREYRKWIEEMLELRYFLPRITAIESVRVMRGAIQWDVQTDYGPRNFVTWGLGDTLQEVKPEWYVVSDVDGNRFQICVPELDPLSKSMLERVV